MSGVSRPVKVFCWLTWKQPSSITRGTARTGQGELRRRDRTAVADAGRPSPARRASRAAPASRTRRARRRPPGRTSASSRARYGPHVRRSCGVGSLAGGAHRTGAVTRTSGERQAVVARRSTSAATRSPVRCIAANRKSPDRSPVNIRPVRLAPCAAGARPTTSTARGRVAEARAPAAPSRSRPGTPPASRRRPARATRPAAGTPGRSASTASSAARSGAAAAAATTCAAVVGPVAVVGPAGSSQPRTGARSAQNRSGSPAPDPDDLGRAVGPVDDRRRLRAAVAGVDHRVQHRSSSSLICQPSIIGHSRPGISRVLDSSGSPSSRRIACATGWSGMRTPTDRFLACASRRGHLGGGRQDERVRARASRP